MKMSCRLNLWIFASNFFCSIFLCSCCYAQIAKVADWESHWEAEQEALAELDLIGCRIQKENLLPEELVQLVDRDKHELVVSIEFKESGLPDERGFPGFQYLASFSKLRVLALENIVVHEMDLAKIRRLESLEELSIVAVLDDETIAKKLVETISSLPKLKKLVVAADKLTDESVESLVKLKNLTTLQLINATSLTDDGIAKLGEIPNLQELSVFMADNISGSGFGEFESFENLTSLKLTWCTNVNDKGLSQICRFRNLTLLQLYNCPEITATGTSNLPALSKLRTLSLTGIAGDDRTAEHLSTLKELRNLELDSNEFVTVKFLAELVELQNLRQLDLASTSMTNDCFQTLLNLEYLESVDLENTDVSESGVQDFQKKRPKVLVEFNSE